jgi:hypothetical protein
VKVRADDRMLKGLGTNGPCCSMMTMGCRGSIPHAAWTFVPIRINGSVTRRISHPFCVPLRITDIIIVKTLHAVTATTAQSVYFPSNHQHNFSDYPTQTIMKYFTDLCRVITKG